MKLTFRFDDICINTDMQKANAMAKLLKDRFPSCEVWFCISPLVHDMSQEMGKAKERVFPRILLAYSDHRNHYKVDKCGVPDCPEGVIVAAHGLIHIDHRLLPEETQAMSILGCCSLIKSNIFVPPFNKWNKITEEICKDNGIELIKFEDGWLSMEHNKYNPNHFKWYLHSRELTIKEFSEWIGVP